MSKLIKTNMGAMPIEDYLDIESSRYGFDSYDDLLKAGYHIDIDENELIDDDELSEVIEMVLSDVSVVCNSHIYVCMGSTTKRFKEIDNLSAYKILGFYVQGQNIFITVEGVAK